MIQNHALLDLAGKLNFISVAQFLREMNWKKVAEWKHCNVFQFTHKEQLWQVNIPNERELHDYNRAMRDVVVTLAEVYNKTEEQIFMELQNPSADILRIRLENDQNQSGSLSVEEAIQLYSNTRKLVTAAAMDVVCPRRHYTNYTNQVKEFVEKCRFGQTEVGSYVVSLICPITPFDEEENTTQKSLMDDKKISGNSFTRQVMNKIMTSAEMVRNSIGSGGLKEILYTEKASENASGVSLNFIEALGGIGIYKNHCRMDLGVQWCSTVHSNRSSIDKISLTHDYFPSIKEVVDQWKKQSRSMDMYVGRIKKLASESDLQKRTQGIITLVFLDEKGTKTADVTLSKEDYDRAVIAHRDGKYVKIYGEISGTKHKKIKCNNFSIIDDENYQINFNEYGSIE